jgi:hypothetical protein
MRTILMAFILALGFQIAGAQAQTQTAIVERDPATGEVRVIQPDDAATPPSSGSIAAPPSSSVQVPLPTPAPGRPPAQGPSAQNKCIPLKGGCADPDVPGALSCCSGTKCLPMGFHENVFPPCALGNGNHCICQ